MQPLNLPEANLRLKEEFVFCQLRKKWVVLTAEEWVRQHLLNLMIHHLSYPKGLMRLEHTITYFRNIKRSDITLLDQSSGIFLLVECKASSIAIDQKVVNQVAQYNKILSAKYMAVSNGLIHFVWKKENSKFIQVKEFPDYP